MKTNFFDIALALRLARRATFPRRLRDEIGGFVIIKNF